MGNFEIKKIKTKQNIKKKIDNVFNKMFALMVFAASLSKHGDDGKTPLTDHLPYKKLTKTIKKQSPPTIDI